MLDNEKVSVSQFKPDTVKKFNLDNSSSNNDNNGTTDTFKSVAFKNNEQIYSPFKMETNFNTSHIKSVKPQSTNPENELVDLLSNLSMNRGKVREDKTLNNSNASERNQVNAYNPNPINPTTQSEQSGPTFIDRAKSGIKGIGQNWIGGNASMAGTIAEFASEGLKNRLDNDVISKDIYTQNMKDKTVPTQQYSDTEKSYIKDALNANKTKEADNYLLKASENTAKGREGLGTVGGFAYDILTGAGQMATDIGTGFVTGTGMLPVLGARVFGQGANEARRDGADINQQMAYGVLSAGIEIATEKNC